MKKESLKMDINKNKLPKIPLSIIDSKSTGEKKASLKYTLLQAALESDWPPKKTRPPGASVVKKNTASCGGTQQKSYRNPCQSTKSWLILFHTNAVCLLPWKPNGVPMKPHSKQGT